MSEKLAFLCAYCILNTSRGNTAPLVNFKVITMALLNTPVCVAKNDLYDESMGAYSMFYLWDGEKVITRGGMYSGLSFDAYSISATLEQKIEASAAYMAAQEEGLNFNKYAYNGRGTNTYVGCEVILKRSRKAPNGVVLGVVSFSESYYCSYYNNEVGEKVVVTDGFSEWEVSVNCIDTVVKGVKEKPFWFVDKSEAKKERLNTRIENLNSLVDRLEKTILDIALKANLSNHIQKLLRLDSIKNKAKNRAELLSAAKALM